jgi:Zn-dependent M28 family amino/carboxypeptidase
VKTTPAGIRIVVSGCFLITILYAITGQSCNAQPANTISSLVEEVSVANIAAHIDALSNGIGPRYTSEPRANAANYIANQLISFGYTVTRAPVVDSVTDEFSENIIAQLPGTMNPDKTFVIGAHFDTVQDSPGADDNASSVAGILEIARVLSDTRPLFSIEFVGFALEEPGLVGSRRYARTAVAQGRELIGMISLDMIGYSSTEANSQLPFFSIPDCIAFSEEGRTVGDFIAVLGNDNSATLLETYQQAATQYVPDLRTITVQVAENGDCFPDARRSDHVPFWDRGYQALLLTDTGEFRNANYHQPSDTLATLDLSFAQHVVQATLATSLIATSTAVPEPSTGIMLLIGMATLVQTRRRMRTTARFKKIRSADAMNYQLENVWPAPSDTVREEVVSFWLAESALPDRPAAEERAHLLLFVARD